MSKGNKERYQSMVLLILLCVVIVVFAAYVANQKDPIKLIEYERVQELPSLIDIQRMLNVMEPNEPIKEDGWYGPATESKWDRVYCNQCASKYFE